ncbi:MAG: hypothetical protein ACJ789_14350 [Thermomicrobiales bacterium]
MLLRFRVSLVVFACVALLSPSWVQIATAQTDATPPAGQGNLDLPAMIPAPEELPDPGFSMRRGMLLDQQAIAARLARGGDVASMLSRVQAAGMLRSYEATYVIIGDDPTTTDHAVFVAVTEFTDDKAATAELADQLIPLGPTVTDVPNAPTVGDASAMHALANVHPSDVEVTSGPFQGIQLVFQTANVLARVMVLDRGAAPGDPVKTAEIGKTFLADIKDVRANGGPGLGDLILHYESAGADTLEGYQRINGAPRRFSDEDDEEYAERQRNPNEAIDGYLYESNFGNVYIAAGIGTYADSDTASRALQYYATQIKSDLSELGATPVAGEHTFGDASVSYAVTEANGTSIYETAAKLDSSLILIALGGQNVPPSAAEDLMTAQIDCLQAGSCIETVSLPPELKASTAAGTPAP